MTSPTPSSLPALQDEETENRSQAFQKAHLQKKGEMKLQAGPGKVVSSEALPESCRLWWVRTQPLPGLRQVGQKRKKGPFCNGWQVSERQSWGGGSLQGWPWLRSSCGAGRYGRGVPAIWGGESAPPAIVLRCPLRRPSPLRRSGRNTQP